ncbi:hypothetical protein Bca52824_059182 [Brassica carinata]|uniref:DUF4283 domain-containing protein n=1 Tax=Brassica carinata TaxID=52824 RepID=A0A8X7QVE1_BRACI|nr:hypothetical protein Bca52824_059182 [Brassica carinata]
MAKKKNKSISLVELSDLSVAATRSTISVTISPSAVATSLSTPGSATVTNSGSVIDSVAILKETAPSHLKSLLPPHVEVSKISGASTAINIDSKSLENVDSQARNYAALLKSSAQLQEMGTPSEHVSGAPFVLISDENIEAAKLEFKDFIYARFHGDYPSMGKIIGVVNTVWARTGPRIFVHKIGQGIYLLRVTNPKTREVLLSRTCWNIGGLPMFVAPWSPEYSPDEPPLTSAIVLVEMCNVPYLLFNRESLSRIATAVGKPESLAPETERKENFEVAKLFVRVDLTAPLPNRIVSCFSNGKEVQIDVSYPWLPIKCDVCKKFGHTKERCPTGLAEGSSGEFKDRKTTTETQRRRSKSRPGRATDKKDLHGNTSETVANAGQSTEVIQNSELVELAQNVDDEVVAPNIPRAGIELHDEPGDPTVENLKEQVLVADVAVAEAAEGTSDVTAATTEEMLTTGDKSNGDAISRGWKFSGNYEENDSGRIVIVWDPKVPMLIYNTTAQSVTCGVTILSENITLTITFVYVDMHLSSPVATHPCSSKKGLPFTRRNMQDDNPISTKIDHAFINQAWSSSFPDSYAEFLDPSQSDHAPCFLRMPSIRRRVVKPFKFFHHVIDHPEYAETVTESWNCSEIMGTNQFKLVRSLKKLKRPLRSLNKRHFSGISQRIKAQKERVEALQRLLITSPDQSTAREEHTERDRLNVLLKAEEKFYRQRSRVRWEDVGDRNTAFYHQTVSQHASRNHIHFIKDANDHLLFSMDAIKAHAADYFQGILGSMDLTVSPATSEELRTLLPFRCSELQQNYLKRDNWSGLDTNRTKSEIFYGGYSNIQMSVLGYLSGFKMGTFPTRYLGLPLSPKRISAATLQPFLERITSKLHSWTVKLLSFAGKVKMIYSVIYGMVNFWSSVFVLPKWFYAKVDSLCSGFLWKNSTSSAVGARVSWVNICKPKSEGGLGIRQLEEFEMVFRLKMLWFFFSASGSLWVPWLRKNRFGGRSLWLINDSPRFSMTVRSMLQLKQELQGLLRCSIGDGKTTLFWYDYWTELGPLYLLFGPSGPRALRIPLNATVSQAVSNGHWNLPPARSDFAETLQVLLSTIILVRLCSSRVTWERIRNPNPLVQWHSVVWFKEEIPRCSFISWTAFLGRLQTRDRLISWGLSVPPGCCAFAAAVWNRFCGRYMASPPASLDAVVALCRHLQGPQVHRVVVILKLLSQVIVYNLWRERNGRIFRDVSLNQEAFFRVVDRGMRDRLLSPSLVTATSPSLLELYFWFLTPYS